MLHACLENNIVVKIVDLETDDDIRSEMLMYSSVINIEDLATRPNIGWTLVGSQWVEGNLPRSSIRSVTPRQIRLSLIRSGVSIESIEQMISSLPSPQSQEVMIWWKYSTEFFRDNSILNSVAPSFGFTQESLDDLFALASTL